MEKQIITVHLKTTGRDKNAQAMWGRCRNQIFRDHTKYDRKDKYRDMRREEEDY